jgi:tetratricopeptide (TPR) repeat protein
VGVQDEGALTVMKRAWNWLLSRLHLRVADTYRHFGNLHGDLREYRSAIDKYNRATALDPAYAQAYFSRGVLYWREIRDYPRAVEDLTLVLELAPGWAEAYFNRGVAFRLQGEPVRAIDDLEHYLAHGTDGFWLDSARRQLVELRAELGAEQYDGQPAGQPTGARTALDGLPGDQDGDDRRR